MKRRTFLYGSVAMATCAVAGTATGASLLDRHHLQIAKVRLDLGLATPLRAAVLGDIHFDPLYETDYLETVFQTLAGQSPDIVFLAGDYVSHSTARFAEFGAIASQFRPRLWSFAAMGNHDLWSGVGTVRRVLEKNGIRVLRNAVAPLPENPGWALAGLDSFWAGRPDPGVFAREDDGMQFISIVHEPDAWNLLTDPRIRLQVSGHTHGGQVRAPFLGALELPTWGREYDAGLFRRGGQFLYVNRGIGTVRIPCRINCRPEITIFELT